MLVSLLMAFVIAAMPGLNCAQTEAGDADDPIAIFNEGQELHEKGNFAEAIKLYEKAISIVADFPEAEYQRGAALLSLGKTDEAERAFRRALELRPEWTLAMTSLGSLLVQKVPSEAEPMLEKVVKAEPQNSLALAALTELRLNEKASKVVLSGLLAKVTTLTAGKANPTASLWAARAALESALGLMKDARASLSTALAIDTSNRTVLIQAAEVALADDDPVRARALVDRLRALAGTGDQVKYLEGAILAYEGKIEDALIAVSAIAKPTRATQELRERLQAKTASPAELEKILATEPDKAEILGRLCKAYRRDDPTKALDYCRRANAAEPENIDHAIGYAAALVQAEQYDAAVNLLRRILKTAPEHATLHANLAAALYKLKRYAEAKPEFEWLARARPSEPTAYFFLAISHDQLGEYIDALANYQRFLRLAEPERDKLDIEKVHLRLPQVEKLARKK